MGSKRNEMSGPGVYIICSCTWWLCDNEWIVFCWRYLIWWKSFGFSLLCGHTLDSLIIINSIDFNNERKKMATILFDSTYMLWWQQISWASNKIESTTFRPIFDFCVGIFSDRRPMNEFPKMNRSTIFSMDYESFCSSLQNCTQLNEGGKLVSNNRNVRLHMDF